MWGLILVYLYDTLRRKTEEKHFRIGLQVGDEEDLAEGTKGVVNGVGRLDELVFADAEYG